MMTLLRRLHYLLNRRRFDAELASDLEVHREMAERSGGMPVGNALLLREESRDAWGWTWIDDALQDLRYGLRVLGRSPAFTAAALLMLAIGIGANVAVFAMFNVVALRPMDVRDPDTLVRFHRRGVEQYAFGVPYPEAAFFREHSRTLAAVIAVNNSRVSIEGEEKPVEASFVTANLFRELGGASNVGRVLDPARDESGAAEPVVVLGHAFWLSHFGGSPAVVGQTLRVNGKSATIVGVAASGFSGVGTGLREPTFWAAIQQQPYFVSGSRLLTDLSAESAGVSLWGRLQRGQGAKAAEEELASLAAELRRQQPEFFWENERLLSEPGAYLTSMMSGNRRGTGMEERDPVYPIFALAGTLTLLILAVACGNLGSMLLARGVARQREISIRVAIGAGNGRLVRQLFTESLLLATLGSLAGLAVGAALLRSLLAISGAPESVSATPDWRVGLFALAMGAGAAVIFGLTPALQAGRRRQRTQFVRQVLIAGQVAASCVLLIVSGLLGRALSEATSTSPGFEYQQAIAISPSLEASGYTPARARTFLEAFEERMRSTPGVRTVGLALSPPLGHVTITVGMDVDSKHVEFQSNHVSPEFFETMAIPILRGRAMRTNERHVVVVSEAMSRQVWPGEDPIGKTLTLGDKFQVIGVAGSVRPLKFAETDRVQAYFPIEEQHWPAMSVIVKTAGSPKEIAGVAMVEARRIDGNIFPSVELMSQAFQTNLRGATYSTAAVSTLGLIADFLACFGIVGVVSYSVSQRTKEIGIRMALGARPRQVLAVVLKQLVGPVVAGLLAGLLAAGAFSEVLRGRLYGLSHHDASAYAGAIAVFALTIVVAALLPAQKALRIVPVRALHHE